MNKTDKQGELREAIYRAGRRYANSKQDAYAVVALQNEVELIYKNLMDGSKAQDVKSASLKDEEAHALAQEITNLRDDLEKRDTKFEELTEQKNNLMKQLLLEIGDGKIEKDKLQATHKAELERVFREIEKYVDDSIGHGQYRVTLSGRTVNGVSGDLEIVWGELKSTIRAIKASVIQPE